MISRLKIMSDIDIAERRKPQDGRMSVRHGSRVVDLRVATLPTVWGEKIVMRILDNSASTVSLRDLNLLEHNYEAYKTSYTKPYGMILVTGPTGSGKSTTLYTTLKTVARPEINVITVEDPVEYRMDGINQVQVNPKAGLTFASALRSILRSDPDVVLIGEIRDHETAQIAVEASLTGHLVLSTLHTNDAPSAITRLTEMGIEPFLVGSAMDCVVAQRLARRLCDRCKQPVEHDAGEARRAALRVRPRQAAAGAVPAGRLHRLLTDGLPGAHGSARGHDGHGGDRAPGRRPGLKRRNRPRGAGTGDVDIARRWLGEGQDGPDINRRDLEGSGLMARRMPEGQ